tara:strand:- start:60 stop:683 length:624 start_codon:yes stop_codon:yes gene_type:complete
LKKIRVSKKFIYLISPTKIDSKNFFDQLEDVFKTKKISFFQLRLKKTPKKKILYIGKKVVRLCKKYDVKFIINDDPYLAKQINSDGCHIGQKDMCIHKVRKILDNKIVGITCHNSKKLIKKAISDKADYIAIGAFFSSKTKKVKFKADIKLLKYAKKITKIPIIVIGGIKLNNYKKLLLNKANFLAISGYVWNSKKYKPIEAIQELK